MKTRRFEVNNRDIRKSLIDDGEVEIGPEYWQDGHTRRPVVRYDRDGYVTSRYSYVYRVVEPPCSSATIKGEESTAFWVAFSFWNHLCFLWMTKRQRKFLGTTINTIVTTISIIVGIVGIVITVMYISI